MQGPAFVVHPQFLLLPGQLVLYILLPYVQAVTLADLPQHSGRHAGGDAVGRNIACHHRAGGNDAARYMVEEINDFKGGMAENYVNVQLSINGYRTYYWKSERGAEIDFVIQCDGQLIPIEVKSADNTKAKSLRVYMDTYKPAYAIKLSSKNFGMEDNKKIVPLYAAFCI